MRRALTVLILTMALLATMTGVALANNPQGDPLPVNGEPSCLGARVSHSASQHDMTPHDKIAATEGTIAYLEGLDESEAPVWAPTYLGYYEDHGVSVRSIMNWIRTNCSDDPYIENP